MEPAQGFQGGSTPRKHAHIRATDRARSQKGVRMGMLTHLLTGLLGLLVHHGVQQLDGRVKVKLLAVLRPQVRHGHLRVKIKNKRSGCAQTSQAAACMLRGRTALRGASGECHPCM